MCAQSVHDCPAAVLPSIPADFISQWVADSADFSHVVNADIEGSGLKWSVQQFCNSTLSAGHLLIDLFGVPTAQCAAIMLHYKLLKANNPTLSAHIVAPSVKRTYNAGFLKPAGMMIQTVQQFKRGRRKAVVVYNPPVVQRRDAIIAPSAGLSSLVQVCLAGTPARALVDTGAEVSFMDSNFAKRSGFSIQATVQPPSIQLANGQQLPITGHVSLPCVSLVSLGILKHWWLTCLICLATS